MSDREQKDVPDEEVDEERRGRGGRFRRIGRRILGESEDGKSLFGEAREMVGVVLEGGDKARSEVVRAIAREVRNYLEELGLKEDLRNLMTNYSLEMHASVNLRRLAPHEKEPRNAPAAKAEPVPAPPAPEGEVG